MDKGHQLSTLAGENPNSIYTRIGGDGQISDLIDQFYYKVLFDKTLRPFFYHADMSRVRLQQKIFFSCQLFGAEGQKYEGRELIKLHQNLGISDENFDAFKKHLESILKDMEKPQSLIEEILEKVESHRPYIIGRKCPFQHSEDYREEFSSNFDQEGVLLHISDSNNLEKSTPDVEQSQQAPDLISIQSKELNQIQSEIQKLANNQGKEES